MTRTIAAGLAGIAVALSLNACGSSDSGPKTEIRATKPPPFRAADFVRQVDNPYFPLTPGTTLRYRGVRDGKPVEDAFTVTGRTRNLQGVQATVIVDRLYSEGRLVEDTVDWYAQDRQGNVWYLGEATREVEDGRTKSTEGSWEVGRDGARAGIFMPAHPRVGQTFQQEFYSGHAEDRFQVIDSNASVRVPFVSSGSALETHEWTPLEPDVVDAKSYVRGIGTVREQALKGGDEHLELVSVTRG